MSFYNRIPQQWTSASVRLTLWEPQLDFQKSESSCGFWPLIAPFSLYLIYTERDTERWCWLNFQNHDHCQHFFFQRGKWQCWVLSTPTGLHAFFFFLFAVRCSDRVPHEFGVSARSIEKKKHYKVTKWRWIIGCRHFCLFAWEATSKRRNKSKLSNCSLGILSAWPFF